MNDINEEYLSDKPHSYGGKYRLYNMFKKGDVDRELTNNNIYIVDSNSIGNQRNTHLYMCTERENSFNQMLSFSPIKNL